MAAGPPLNTIIEIEFTPGNWTDVTLYVDWSAGCRTTFGRSTPFSAVQVSTMTLTLDNTDGRFTPASPALADNVTANPNYPNVQPRKRIRRTLVTSVTSYVRFVGYIKSWPAAMIDGVKPRVTLIAEDRSRRFGTVTMLGSIPQEIYADDPAAYWPLGDDGSGGGGCVEATGQAPDLIDAGFTPAITYGVRGPAVDSGSAVQFSQAAAVGDYLYCYPYLRVGAGATVTMWANAGTTIPSSPNQFIVMWRDSALNALGFQIQAGLPSIDGVNFGPSVLDGGWHHYAMTLSPTAPYMTFYLDGVLVHTYNPGAAPANMLTLMVSGLASPPAANIAQFTGSIAHVAYFPTVLSPTRLALHTLMGNLRGELVSDRIARYLGYANIPASDQAIGASIVPCGTYPQAGKDVATALQDTVTTEGGNAVLYAAPTGGVIFLPRSTISTAPVMTLDAAGDIDGDDYSPTFGDDELLNTVTGTRSTGSGASLFSTLVQNAASIAAFDLAGGSDFTSYAQHSSDVQHNAEDRVSRYGTPAFRLDQFTVNMRTAQTAGLYDALGSLTLLSRVRLVNLYAAAAPYAQLDVIVQGGVEIIRDTAYDLQLLASAADNPAEFVMDDPVYGRAQASGHALTNALGTSSTNLTITSPAGQPVFSNLSTDYPFTIIIDQEHVSLTAPSASSTSPQLFTGCVRGMDGTAKLGHAAGALVDLWPTLTVAL